MINSLLINNMSISLNLVIIKIIIRIVILDEL